MTGPRDARSLDHVTLEELRRLAVRRVLEGQTQQEVARTLQVHFVTVCRWVGAYREGGESELAGTKAPGPEPKLTERKTERLRRTILGKNPQQLNFGPALWTLRLVEEVIRKLFRVVLHKSTIGRLLHRLGLTPQKPVRRAFQRDEAECVRWMTQDFPRIVREARRRQATLLFEDETGVHEDGPAGTTWGAEGKRPVVGVTGSRRRTNVISVISPRGRLWFRCYGGTLDATRFIEFLEALLHDFSKPVELILDRHPAHVAASVMRFVEKHPRRLRLHFLPGYAPTLNPDEHVWGYLKGMFRRDPMHWKEDLIEAVNASMGQIQKDRDLVRSFFKNPEFKYVREALAW